MRLRVLLVGVVALAGLPPVASALLAPEPAAASDVSLGHAAGVSVDIRGGEYPAGDPAGAGSIKPGDGATFSVSVYGYNPALNSYGPLPMGIVASDFRQAQVHFRLYYGWGQKGVVTENGCTGIGKGDTSFCYHQASQPYFGPSGHSQGSPETVWLPTTDVPAPSTGLTTLFDAIWLIPGPPGDRAAPLAESRAGNFVYGLAAKQVFLTSDLGSGPQEVSFGTSVVLTACITNGNCTHGLVSAGNFLGDYLYVCGNWPPFGTGGVPVTEGLPKSPPQHWWSGKADQVLGGIKQSLPVPAGQNWSVFYNAFASSHANLAHSGICPTSPGEVNAGTATGIGTDYASLMVTWDGPVAVPPMVSLIASSAHPSAKQDVSFTATATNPDGNSGLYICARSGTSWLSLSSPDSDGYLGAAPVSTPTPRAVGKAAAISGQGGTAQFVAFLSKDLVHPSSCPAPGTDSAAYGTSAPSGWTAKSGPWHSSYDYSAVVNVTWPTPKLPPVSTTTTTTTVPPHHHQGGSTPTTTTTTPPGPGKMSVTLTANPSVPTAGHKTVLTAIYTGAVPGTNAYICQLNGTPMSLSAQKPYAAGGPVTSSSGQIAGWALSSTPATATFVAYLSNEAGQATSGSCPDATGQQGATAIASLSVVWLPASSAPLPYQQTVPPFNPQFVPAPRPPCYWVTETVKNKKKTTTIEYQVCPPAPQITVTLQAVPSTGTLLNGEYTPGQKVTLVATVSNQPAGDYIEIRALGPDQPKIAGPGEWLGSPVQGTSMSGVASGNLVNSEFVAYDTPYPGSNIVRAMSNVVSLHWGGWHPE